MSQDSIEEKLGVTGLAHLGIVVKDFDTTLAAWQALGLKVSESHEVPSEGVRTHHLPLCAGGAEVELLEPLDEESGVAKFLAKRGPGIHHVALKVADIEASLAKAREAGLVILGEAPRPGAGGTKVAFIHPKSMGGVLTELVEFPDD